MPTVEEIAETVVRDCGEQPEELLRFDTVVGLVVRSVRYYLGQLSSSDQMQSNAILADWTPQMTDGVVPGAGAETIRIAYVERRLDDYGRQWESVPIVKLSSINQFYQSGQWAIAFYDNYTKYRLSWSPEEYLYADTLRLHKDLLFSDVPKLAESPNFPAKFHEMCGTRATIEALPLILANEAAQARKHGRFSNEQRAYALGLRDFVQMQLEVQHRKLREQETEWKFYCFEAPEQEGFTTPSFSAGRRARRGGYY